MTESDGERASRKARRVTADMAYEKRILAALSEAALHCRRVAFFCETARDATRSCRRLEYLASSMGLPDPSFIGRFEVRFGTGGVVRFVCTSIQTDGIDPTEVVWI